MMNDEGKSVVAKSPKTPEVGSSDIQNQPITVKFRKIKMDSINLTGRYRGTGSLQLMSEGLRISGKHVFSLGARWAIGLGIFIGSLILSIAATGGAGYCAPGFIPIYFLMEYFILKREDILIPYSDITQLAVASQSTLIGIDFKGNPQTSPVFMETPAWNSLQAAIQRKIPSVSVSSADKVKRKSLVLIIVLVTVICIFIIGIIAAIAIPNLLIAKQRAMQKSAMTDIQRISTALMDYTVDNPEPDIREWTLDAGGELHQALVPFYIPSLPTQDPWGNDYQIHFSEGCREVYGLSADTLGTGDFLVISHGRDGIKDLWFYDMNDPESGLYSGLTMDDFDNDLVMWNGSWIRRPR